MALVVCIATGPSLTQDDVDFCNGRAAVYAVNDAYKIAPWADLLYAADGTWWDVHNGAPDFAGEKWTVNPDAAEKYHLNYIAPKSKAWSTNKSYIATGGNSGFQAMNLARVRGASKIVLLGYDYGYTDKKHFFGDHHPLTDRHSDYALWIKLLNKAAVEIDIPVVNCSRKTAITCFPRMTIQEALDAYNGLL